MVTRFLLAAVLAAAAILGLAASGSAKAPTGTPIVVMTTAAVNSNFSTYENIIETAKAYGKWINDRGGINGHPLKVLTCDDRNDPNQIAFCGRQAIAKHVVAIVGNFTINGGRIIPILEKNNTAWFGICCPVVAAENTSKVSFPVGSGAAGLIAGAAYYTAKVCKTSTVILQTGPFVGFIKGLVTAGYKGAGKPAPKIVELPAVAQDYSPQAAQATSGNPQCILNGNGETSNFAFLPALQQTGWKGTQVGIQGNLDAVVIAKAPETAEGAVIVGSYPELSDPRFAAYRQAIKQYKAKPSLDYDSLGGLGTWAGYVAFTNIVKTMKGPITNETFLAAASKASHVTTGGQTPPLDFTKEWNVPNLNRIFNRTIALAGVHNGRLYSLNDKFYDMSGPIQGKPGPAMPAPPTR